MKDIFKLGLFLAVVAALAAGVLVLTYIATADKIEMEKQKEINNALKEIMPDAVKFEELEQSVFSAKDKRSEIGKVFQVTVSGYAGPIDIMVGIYKNGEVAGIKIITISETPGLGLNATDPKFLEQFKGKTAADPITPKKDIAALTGATITTRAVCDGIKQAINKSKIKQ